MKSIKKIGLGTPTLTTIRLFRVDQSIKRTVGVLFDVWVKVDRFILSADFVVLVCEKEQEIPIIHG